MTINLHIDKLSVTLLDQVQFEQIITLLNRLEGKVTTNMAVLDDKLAALQAEVTRNTTVEKSALALLQGIPALITAAVNAALAAGATPAQLQAITDLSTSLATNDDELAAAVAANTPAAPPTA